MKTNQQNKTHETLSTLSFYITGKNDTGKEHDFPVELNSFDVQKQDNICRIAWFSDSPGKSFYFAIQRSTNGFSYTDIGRVYPSGNPGLLTQYNYTDIQPSTGINNYRLKIVAPNLNCIYSTIRSITVLIEFL